MKKSTKKLMTVTMIVALVAVLAVAFAACNDGPTVESFKKPFTAQIDALVAVQTGQCSYAIVDKTLADQNCGKGNFDKLTYLDKDFGFPIEKYAVAFKKGNPLQYAVNEQLEAVAADGTLMEIAEKYKLTAITTKDFSDQKLAAGEQPKYTKNKETVVIGVTPNKPMNYTDSNGEWTLGFDTELAIEVFKRIGFDEDKIIFKEIQWADKYMLLESKGTVDCVWNGFTANSEDSYGGATKQRNEIVDFSYTYMDNQQVIVVKKDSSLTKATKKEDFANQICAFEAGSSGQSCADNFVTMK